MNRNKSFKLNPVFGGLKPSSTLYINETVNQLWQQGEQVFHMGFGESRFDVHPKLKQSLQEHSDKKKLPPSARITSIDRCSSKLLFTQIGDWF